MKPWRKLGMPAAQTRKIKKAKKVNETQPAYILKQKLKKMVNKRLNAAAAALAAAAAASSSNTTVGKRKRSTSGSVTSKKPKKSKNPWGPRNTINV